MTTTTTDEGPAVAGHGLVKPGILRLVVAGAQAAFPPRPGTALIGKIFELAPV